MKKVVFFLFMTLFATAMLYAQTPTEGNYVKSEGKAERNVQPDRIKVRVVLNESDTKGKVSLQTMETRLKNVLLSMKINIDKDVQMLNASSQFGKVRWLGGNEALTSETFLVILSNGDQVSTLLQKLSQQGISNVSVYEYEYSKMDELKDTLLVEAMKNSKQKAQMMSSAIGQSIGKAFRILEGNSYSNNYNLVLTRATMSKSDSATGAPVFENIQVKPITVTAEVIVFYQLE